jgi:hypothetical protein
MPTDSEILREMISEYEGVLHDHAPDFQKRELNPQLATLRKCAAIARAVEAGEVVVVSAAAVDALIEEVKGFAEAYPESCFGPVTDDERAQHGSLITRTSASMGRHMGRRFLPKVIALAAAPQFQEEGK